MSADDFYPPMPYSPLWLAIGIVIIAAIGGWALVIWAQTRPPRPVPVPAEPPGWRLERLRAGALARVDEIVRLAQDDELTARRAHQELSVAVRQFVEEASGLAAPTMTLTELYRSGEPALRPVTDVVLRLYPAEFGPGAGASLLEAARVARGVVARWT